MPHKPVFATNRCLRFRGGDCSLCAAVCPAEAVSLIGSPRLDAAACVQCGACAAACPTNAVSHPASWRPIDTVSLHEPSTVSLACHALPSLLENAVRLEGCHSSIGLDVLAHIALSNVQAVHFLHGDCARCERGDQLRLFSKTITTLRELCPMASAKFSCIRHKSARPAEKHAVSRRDFFSLFRRSSKTTHTTDSKGSSAKAPEQHSARERLHHALRTLLARESSPESLTGKRAQALPHNLHVAELHVADTCTGCGVCAKVCPTDALRFTSDEKGFRLTFELWKCIDCGLCHKTCLPRSISRTRPDLAAFLDTSPQLLQAMQLQPCKRCRAATARLINGYCPICARKLDM